MKYLQILLLINFLGFSCQNTISQSNAQNEKQDSTQIDSQIMVGAERLDEYLPLLWGEKVALVANQSSLVAEKHLLDVLVEKKINVVKIFALEHGFRGNAERGATIKNGTDEKTGVPIVSLFGKGHKPTPESLANVDIVVFDIQDAGARFFTYISSMHNIMEACAENNIKLLILDRPNPLGDYVDGPIRQKGFESFVGMHPIPIVHGLTVGELALMINGEGWLKDGKQCNVTIIEIANYKHSTVYELPVRPSPNLPNYLSLRLYPSLCLFESTQISIGRGTDFPFQVIGYPDAKFGKFTFTPHDIEGVQMNPEQEGKLCYGIDLRNEKKDAKFTLKYIIDFYNKSDFKTTFFAREKWFNLLIGNDAILKMIKEGKSEDEIRQTWQADLEKYKEMRKHYLLYD